jgi:hypothetical protein
VYVDHTVYKVSITSGIDLVKQGAQRDTLGSQDGAHSPIFFLEYSRQLLKFIAKRTYWSPNEKRKGRRTLFQETTAYSSTSSMKCLSTCQLPVKAISSSTRVIIGVHCSFIHPLIYLSAQCLDAPSDLKIVFVHHGFFVLFCITLLC